MRKASISVLVVLALAGVLLLVSLVRGDGKLKGLDGLLGSVTSSDFVYLSKDVVGTKSGTSTVGVWFDKTGVTTTYVTKIGDRQEAVYTVLMTVANTSTAGNVKFAVQGSNDYNCDTATTSPSEVAMADINWFPAGDNLLSKGQTTALTNASSTNVVTWTSASVGNGQTLQLEKLNFQCLKLGISAVSSTLYVGLKTR